MTPLSEEQDVSTLTIIPVVFVLVRTLIITKMPR